MDIVQIAVVVAAFALGWFFSRYFPIDKKTYFKWMGILFFTFLLIEVIFNIVGLSNINILGVVFSLIARLIVLGFMLHSTYEKLK